MKTTSRAIGPAASRKIDQRIAELGDWRGETLARARKLIHDVDPDIVEEWKWMGTPVWSHDGGVCTGESHKQVVKLTFFRGASLDDPKKLFNSSLDGFTRRAIDLHEGEKLDTAAFKALVRAAIAANRQAREVAPGRKTGKRTKASKASKARSPVASPVHLPIPHDLEAALREEGVLPAWESLPPGLRAYLLKAIDQAVHEVTRTKRIVGAVEAALARREKQIDRGAR